VVVVVAEGETVKVGIVVNVDVILHDTVNENDRVIVVDADGDSVGDIVAEGEFVLVNE
jgi:hypothetical protein